MDAVDQIVRAVHAARGAVKDRSVAWSEIERNEDVAKRFWSKVNKIDPNGCWVWTGASNKYGGFFGFNKQILSPHRLSLGAS